MSRYELKKDSLMAFAIIGLSILSSLSFCTGSVWAQTYGTINIVVDSSESMGRRIPKKVGTKPAVVILDAISEALELAGEKFTNPRAPGSFVSINTGHWITLRQHGGYRQGQNRTCYNSDPGFADYFPSPMPDSWIDGEKHRCCMVSNFRGNRHHLDPECVSKHDCAYGADQRRLLNAFSGMTPSDQSMIGWGLRDTLGSYNALNWECPLSGDTPPKPVVVFFTDGGESCNRQPSSPKHNDPVTILNTIESNIENSILIVVLVAPISTVDEARMRSIAGLAANQPPEGGEGYVPEVGYSTVYTANSVQEINTITANIIGALGSPHHHSDGPMDMYKYYEPCAACDPTEQDNCNCCIQANSFRDNNCNGQPACGTIWGMACDDTPLPLGCGGPSPSPECNLFCGQVGHPCTTYCGSPYHPCTQQIAASNTDASIELAVDHLGAHPEECDMSAEDFCTSGHGGTMDLCDTSKHPEVVGPRDYPKSIPVGAPNLNPAGDRAMGVRTIPSVFFRKYQP